jgi:hypothetical protein
VVSLKVDEIITRALTDTGAGSTYISAKVGDFPNKKPSEASTKRIEMLMGSHLTRMEMYDVTVESLDNSFKITWMQSSQRLTRTNCC